MDVGAAVGWLRGGYVGEGYGCVYGFGAAGFGMLAGRIVFGIGKPLLKGKGESSNPARLRERVAGLPFEWLLYLFGIVLVVACWWMVQNQSVVGWGLGVTGVALPVYVGWTAITKLDPHARDRIFAAVFLMIGSVLFSAQFELAVSSLHLYTYLYPRWEER